MTATTSVDQRTDVELDQESDQVDDQQLLTEEEAERLTGQIESRLSIIVDTYEEVMQLIREAYDREAYKALRYPSHGAYVQDRFGGTLPRLPVGVRRAVVLELTEE